MWQPVLPRAVGNRANEMPSAASGGNEEVSEMGWARIRAKVGVRGWWFYSTRPDWIWLSRREVRRAWSCFASASGRRVGGDRLDHGPRVLKRLAVTELPPDHVPRARQPHALQRRILRHARLDAGDPGGGGFEVARAEGAGQVEPQAAPIRRRFGKGFEQGGGVGGI